MANSLDIVAVGIEHEGAVIIGVIFRPEPWRAVIGGAGKQRGRMEGIDRFPAGRGESDVHWPAWLIGLAQPEKGLLA